MSDTNISIKTKIDTNLLNWYFEDSNCFYLLINKNGGIESFSENSMIFFSLEEIYTLENKHLSSFIGSDNWHFISSEITKNTDQIEFVELPFSINRNNLLVKWKSNNDDYFILFKKNIVEKLPEDDAEIKPIENKLNYYEKIISQLVIPAALIKEDNFTFKNNEFELFLNSIKIADYNSFNEWILKNQFTDENEEQIKFSLDNIDYKVVTAVVGESDNEALTLLYFIKETLKINEAEKTAEETDDENNNLIKKSIIELKNNLEITIHELSESFNYDFESVKNQMDSGITGYKEIALNVQDNILKISNDFNFIDDISVRIHLISINAAIESAKKGEHGKGFAVISREIAKLSNEIKDYTKKIEVQIKTMEKQTKLISSVENSDDDKVMNNNIKAIEENHIRVKDGFYKIKSLIENSISRINEEL